MCEKAFWNDPHNKAMANITEQVMIFRDMSRDVVKSAPDLYSQRVSGELIYKTNDSLQQPSDLFFRLFKKKLIKQAKEIKEYITQMRKNS